MPLGMFVVFAAVGAALWRSKGEAFYLFNFGYIGGALAIGLGL